eukprot:COSAG04_NODE_8680_length_943_cov_0.761848_1_plen_142_part_00
MEACRGDTHRPVGAVRGPRLVHRMAPRRVRLGDGELPLDATGGRGTMGWMRDSTALYPGVGAGGVTYQPSTEAQRSVALERLNEDGYLLLRGLLSRAGSPRSWRSEGSASQTRTGCSWRTGAWAPTSRVWATCSRWRTPRS